MSKSPTSLLDLPPELRLMIYKDVFDSTRVVYNFHKSSCPRSHRGGSRNNNAAEASKHFNALLRSSRLCYAEAVDVFFERATVYWNFHHDHYRVNQNYDLQRLAPLCSRLVKLVIGPAVSENILKRITRWPSMPRLKEATVKKGLTKCIWLKNTEQEEMSKDRVAEILDEQVFTETCRDVAACTEVSRFTAAIPDDATVVIQSQEMIAFGDGPLEKTWRRDVRHDITHNQIDIGEPYKMPDGHQRLSANL